MAHPLAATATPFQQVREFCIASRGHVSEYPTADLKPGLRNLRQGMIEEEVAELREAVAADDLVAIADALADIVYVACGTAVAYGLPFDEIFSEVHRSNMTKIGPKGPVLRGDGKIAKGPQYSPPDIGSCIHSCL